MRKLLLILVFSVSTLGFSSLSLGHAVFDASMGTIPMNNGDNIKPDTVGASAPPCGELQNSETVQLNANDDYTLYWLETVPHSGAWEVYFSPTGPCPVQNIFFNNGEQSDCWHPVLRIEDPNNPVAGMGAQWNRTIKVPNINCNNCVFQLRQIMNGANAVVNPNDPYYSCHRVSISGATDDGSNLAPQCKVINTEQGSYKIIESKNDKGVESHVSGHSHDHGHH